MALINRKFPGKSAAEIFEQVDKVMEGIAQRHSLDYRRDPGKKTGEVQKLGATGRYVVSDGEVNVELKFPMLVPGSMRRKVEEDIERKLDGLFS